jgi:hypothetical protein
MLKSQGQKGCEVQAGAGQEAAETGGPVLHPLEPGLDQDGELGEVSLARDRLRCDQIRSMG